jgi:hypothetical protein
MIFRSVLLTNSVPGYKTNKYFRSILMPGQPFSISGDTTLTTRRDVSGRYFISVERLFGNEVFFIIIYIIYWTIICLLVLHFLMIPMNQV